MKHILLILLVLPFLGFSQIGINTITPNASSVLDVTATNKGVLLPQIDLQSATDAATIANPAKSLLVWNTGATWGDSAYYYNSGTAAAPVWSKLQGSDDLYAYEYVENTSSGSTSIPMSSTWLTLLSLTIPSNGIWDIGAEGIFDTAPGAIGMKFTINGSDIPGSGDYAHYSSGHYNSLKYKFENNITLNAGDVINFQAISLGGSANILEGTEPTRIWAKKVAGLLPVTVSSSYETGIAKFYNNTVQTSVADGTNVTLNTTEANSISAYVTMAAGVITLQPGTYELTGSVGGIITTTSAGNARIWNGFYNITTSNYIGHGGVSMSGNAGNYNGAPHNAAHAVITVTTATEIALRINRKTYATQISHGSDFLTPSLGRAWVSVKKFN